MAVNLTPQYHEAEERYRKAKTGAERLACLEEMWVQLPKHKASEKLQAQLKSKLSKAREELDAPTASTKGGAQNQAKIQRQGAGQVLLVGPPNSGKSQFLATLTEAKAEVAPYPFTTRIAQAGMMKWEEARIQLVDTPPITADVLDPQTLSLLRQADSCFLFTDLSDDDGFFQTLAVIDKLKEYKTHLVAEPPEGNEDWTLAHVSTVLIGTRSQDPGAGDRLEVIREMIPDGIPFITAELQGGDNSHAEMREAVWKSLRMIRVFPKKPGKPSDREDMVPLDVGGTVQDLAASIHGELGDKVKSARIWGSSASSDGVVVSKTHVLMDGDVVEIQS